MSVGSVALAVLVYAILIGSSAFGLDKAYAHNFDIGESAEFLTVVEVIQVQTALAANAADQQVAMEHMEHASAQLTEHVLEEISERNERIAQDLPQSLEELEASIVSGANADELNRQADQLHNLLGEAVQVRIERDHLNNSTIQAGVVANLVSKALEHYGKAVGFEGNMTDMTSMNTTHSGMEGTDHVSVVSEADYQSALAFAQRALEKYSEIRDDAIAGMDEPVDRLDAAFPNFVRVIEDMMPATDVMNVAHMEIHPNLLAAYDLQIIPEFPLPLLLLIPAMAGAAMYGRFKRF